jgi:hypothetical protein
MKNPRLDPNPAGAYLGHIPLPASFIGTAYYEAVERKKGRRGDYGVTPPAPSGAGLLGRRWRQRGAG